MKWYDLLLSPLGLTIAVGSQFWQRLGNVLPGEERYWLIAAGVLVLLHPIVRYEAIVNAIGRRQLRYGGNTLALSLVVLGILGAVNYLVVRNPKRIDLTENQRYSLSDQTQKVLAGLKDDVRLTYFERSARMLAGQDRLKEYQAASPRLKVEFVDPVKEPMKAQAKDVRGPWPMLVIERGDRVERLSNDSEQDLTNALIKVTREGKKTVCFVEGQGELDPDGSGDLAFSSAKAALTRSLYETKKVLLLREKAVPADCTVLLLAGPQKDLLPPAIDAVRAYVTGGGKAFVMLEPELKDAYPNLVALLKEWNLEAGNDVVVDVSGIGQLFGTGALTPIVAQFPYHEITKDFRVMTAFHTARSLQAGSASVAGVSAQNLLETSPQSWAESDLKLKEPIEMTEGKDRRGPITLGAVVTLRDSAPAPEPSPSPAADAEPKQKKEGRVVAIGDVDFASNAMLGFQGNQDFFLNAVAWLAEDADMISIRPREPEDQRLFLTQTQQQNVSLLSLVVLPGLFVVFGIAAWWRRR
jgi:ABC-type uncharacterized transport system involved in gliding motility auxiliary subunit